MDDGTRIRDEIRFSTRWGPLGRRLVRRHLEEFLIERNAVIKRVAESEEWRRYLESWTEASMTTLVEGGKASRWDGNGLLRVRGGSSQRRRRFSGDGSCCGWLGYGLPRMAPWAESARGLQDRGPRSGRGLRRRRLWKAGLRQSQVKHAAFARGHRREREGRPVARTFSMAVSAMSCSSRLRMALKPRRRRRCGRALRVRSGEFSPRCARWRGEVRRYGREGEAYRDRRARLDLGRLEAGG